MIIDLDVLYIERNQFEYKGIGDVLELKSIVVFFRKSFKERGAIDLLKSAMASAKKESRINSTVMYLLGFSNTQSILV